MNKLTQDLPKNNKKSQRRLEIQARNMKLRKVFIAVIMVNRMRRLVGRKQTE